MLQDLTESSSSWNAEGIESQAISELELTEFSGRSDMGLKAEGTVKNAINLISSLATAQVLTLLNERKKKKKTWVRRTVN